MSTIEQDWKEDLKQSASHLSSGVFAGFLAGFVFGGIGGRLSMLILRLTSDPSLHGMETDDGFIIGRVSGDSFFLIFFTTAIGILGGLFYLGVRDWIPRRWRVPAMGIFGAAVGGAVVIHPDGIDFNVLEPLWLAIAMYIALPAAYGVVMSWLTERLLERRQAFGGRVSWVAVLLPLLPIFMGAVFGLIFMAVALAFWVANHQVQFLRLWSSEPVTWIGRLALVAIVGISAVALVRDVGEIL